MPAGQGETWRRLFKKIASRKDRIEALLRGRPSGNQ